MAQRWCGWRWGHTSLLASPCKHPCHELTEYGVGEESDGAKVVWVEVGLHLRS